MNNSSETIRFRCKECGQTFEAPTQDGGLMVNCGCGRKLKIPRLGGEPDPATGLDTMSAQAKRTLILMLIVGAAFVVSVIGASIQSYAREEAMAVYLVGGVVLFFGASMFLDIWLPHAAKIVLSLGVLGIGLCFYLNLMTGVIACGFIAVLGAIFLLKPRTATK